MNENKESTNNTNFLTDQIITYLGNKRKLLNHIAKLLDIIEEREQGKQLSMADAFSGSGIVARLFKTRASHLYVNDCAGYSETLNKCFLSSPTKLFTKNIMEFINKANKLADENILDEKDAWISKHWAPKGEITKNHRVYFTEQMEGE